MAKTITILGLFISGGFLLSACGLLQFNHIERMESVERHEYLNAIDSERLCLGVTHPLAKGKTLQQLEEILRSRGVTTCEARGKFVSLETENKQIVSSGSVDALSLEAKQVSPVVAQKSTNANSGDRSASDLSAISVEYWKLLLSEGGGVKDASWLSAKGTAAADKATLLLKEEKKMQGLALSVEAHVLSQQAHVWIENEGGEHQVSLAKNKDALKKSRDVLIHVGVKPEVLDASIANLGDALSIIPGFQSSRPPQSSKAPVAERPKEPRPEPQSRSATMAERDEIEAEVKKGLSDPMSAVFGEAILFNEKYGCLGVNAKNRFGGYTGEKGALIVKGQQNQWTWVLTQDSRDGCVKLVKGVLERQQ